MYTREMPEQKDPQVLVVSWMPVVLEFDREASKSSPAEVRSALREEEGMLVLSTQISLTLYAAETSTFDYELPSEDLWQSHYLPLRKVGQRLSKVERAWGEALTGLNGAS